MRPLIIDSFAGGGGASTGIERALGRSPDIAVNHDADALAMHEANHPDTLHLAQDIWTVDPLEHVAPGQDVGLAWFSPDCRHFSKAKGGKPVKKEVRGLAWVVVRWAKRVRPRVIIVENVEEFRTWGPLTKDSKPCPKRRGQTFNHWVRALERLGYRVEMRELRACDYGDPTIRKRLFIVARRDGLPIVWPEPTHGRPGTMEVVSGYQKPWRTAAECIDWTVPVHSIFLTKEEGRAVGVNRPLSANTLKRIALGVQKYVIEAKQPFLVPITHTSNRAWAEPTDEPLRTITTARGGERALVVPTLVQTGYGERKGQAPRTLDIEAPLGTVVAGGGKHALVAAFLAQHNTGVVGRRADAPLSTVTVRGAQQAIVAAHLLNLKGTKRADQSLEAPAPTITAHARHAALVSAFMVKYYGTGDGARCDEPMHTVTTKERFGLVTLDIDGTTWAIADIGMRMLTPRELFLAQGFPPDYEIERGADGQTFTKVSQIAKCGNSVPPGLAAALVGANCSFLIERRMTA